MKGIQKKKTLNLPEFFQQYVGLETLSGIVLLVFSALALILSNSALSNLYHQFLNIDVGITIGKFKIYHSLHYWINEGLMAVFFFVIGLEIKRELLFGELSSRKKVILPVIAAIGGAVLPAVIYLLFNAGTEGTQGWGIPMATDIAFVLGIISLLGKKVPRSIKVFVLAFAIIDDLIAIVVIAAFYTDGLNIGALMLGIGIIAMAIILKIVGSYQTFFFLLMGIISWFAILESGIHPTIAGAAMAITIPSFHKNPVNSGTESPLNRLIHTLHPISSFFIMPVFALANASIQLISGSGILSSLFHPISIGVITGLFIGKPMGLFLSIWVCVKLKIAALPSGTNWKHILAMACLGGMGFTLSLFISVLAFEDEQLLVSAKFGVLAGSLISAITGCLLFILKNNHSEDQ